MALRSNQWSLSGLEDEVIVNKAVFYLVLNKAVDLNLRWVGKPSLWFMLAGITWARMFLDGSVMGYELFIM